MKIAGVEKQTDLRGATGAGVLVAVMCAATLCGATGYSATVDPVLESYLKAAEKFRYQKMQDPSTYFKTISRVKIHWMKPKENADGTVTLKWDLPAANVVNYHLLDTAWILVSDAATGKGIVQKSAVLKNKYLTYKFPALGNYTLSIWAANKSGKSTARTSFAYTARKYVAPIPAKEKQAVISGFYSFMAAHAYEFDSCKTDELKAGKMKELLWKWRAGQGKVTLADWGVDREGVTVQFNDYSAVYVKLPDNMITWRSPIDPDDYVSLPDLSDDPVHPPDIAVAVPEPVLPASRKALVVHGLGVEEVGNSYPRAVVEQGLRDAGFDDLTIIGNDEVGVIDRLMEMDTGQYGFIYYNHHGGTVRYEGEEYFGMGIPPYYDALPEVEHIGVIAGAQPLNTGETKYMRIFTRPFIDTYCGDMPFPRSCLYWYACGSALDDPTVDDLYISFVEKGAICGWLGMNNGDALVEPNNYAARGFFTTLPQKPYLADALAAGRAAGMARMAGICDLRLLNEEAVAYNRAWYIDRDFVDLGIRRVTQAPGGLFSIMVGNEGTLTAPPNTEIIVGCKNARFDAPDARISAVQVPEGLQRGKEFEVLMPPVANGTHGVGIDIDGAIPEDAAPDNNTRGIRPEDFLPDLVITACARLENGNVGITIANTGLYEVSNMPGRNPIFVDALYEGQDQPLRVSVRFIGIRLSPGASYQAELPIPAGVASVTLTLDSTNLVPEFDENNTITFVIGN